MWICNIKYNWKLLDYKKVTCAKDNCLIDNISLVIMCLLLLIIISVNCYSYYTKYQSEKPFQNIKVKLENIGY